MARGLFATLFLTDLDNTIFQSKWLDQAGIFPMSNSLNGDPQGFATPAQAELWDSMRHTSFCVGVTGRTLEQVARVDGWNPIHENQLMLADHGMTLLYRSLKRDHGWEVVDSWSSTYVDTARAHAKEMESDATRLFFMLMERMPELVTLYGSKVAHAAIPASENLKVFFSLRAPEFYRDVMDGNVPQRLVLLRSLLRQFIAESHNRYRMIEADGSFSLLPSWFSTQAAVQRLIRLMHEPGHDVVDPRLQATLKDIGRPKLVLTAGDSLEDVAFMGIGHFMITPTRSAIGSLVQDAAERIPVLDELI
jgi:hypothetical protein